MKTAQPDIKKQFNQGLFSRIEKLAGVFASPKSYARHKDRESTCCVNQIHTKNACVYTTYPEQTNYTRSKTPQPNAYQNTRPRSISKASINENTCQNNKVNVKELNNRLYYEYLKFQRDKTGADTYYSSSANNTNQQSFKSKNLLLKTTMQAENYASTKTIIRPVTPIECDQEIQENFDPNKNVQFQESMPPEYSTKCKNLLLLLNKEREAVSNVKTELQRVCVESRQEKHKLQQEIEELSQINSTYYKQYLKEKENNAQIMIKNNQLTHKLESASTQIRTLVNYTIDTIEKLFILQFSPPPSENTTFSRKKDPLEETRDQILANLAKVNSIEGGVNLSEELNKLSALQEKVAMYTAANNTQDAQKIIAEKTDKIPSKLQTWATNGLEEIQEEIWEPTETLTNHKAIGKNTEKSTRDNTNAVPSERNMPEMQNFNKIKSPTKQCANKENKVPPVKIERKNTVLSQVNTHKGSEIFGPVLSAIEASGIVENPDVGDHASLLKTLENLNMELGNLSLTEDAMLSPVEKCVIKKDSQYNQQSNAMKELEEIKARILNRKVK